MLSQADIKAIAEGVVERLKCEGQICPIFSPGERSRLKRVCAAIETVAEQGLKTLVATLIIAACALIAAGVVSWVTERIGQP